MYRIVHGGFKQETNTFSPLTCNMSNYLAGGVFEGDEVLDAMLQTRNDYSGMLHTLLDADVELITSISMNSGSYGRVEQGICDYFIQRITKTIRKSLPIDGVFLNLHGGMSLTEDDDGIGHIIAEIRKVVGPDVVIAASTDLHANITKRVMRNIDVISGYLEYPHTDAYETGCRAAKLGLYCLDNKGKKPAMAFAKLPMILQAEAGSTKHGPLKALVDYAKSLVSDGKLMDYTMYHMQPWMDILEAGATVVTVAEDPETARKYATELARRFFELRKVLICHNENLDDVLDLAEKSTDGKLIVLSDSSDNVSGGATGDSVNVLRRILERKMDLRVACVVADPVAPYDAEKLGEGAEAEFTIGGKYDPSFYHPVTFNARVEKICNPIVKERFGPHTGVYRNFVKAAILRVRNVDVVVAKYAQFNFSPTQFVGFGLNLADYDLVVVKSSLAYRQPFAEFTDEAHMHTVDTPGSCSCDLVGLGFKRVERPMHPFDKMPDDAAPGAILKSEL